MGVFKTYDIRGIYGPEIDEELAYKIGRAFARFLAKDSYMIGLRRAPALRGARTAPRPGD